MDIQFVCHVCMCFVMFVSLYMMVVTVVTLAELCCSLNLPNNSNFADFAVILKHTL